SGSAATGRPGVRPPPRGARGPDPPRLEGGPHTRARLPCRPRARRARPRRPRGPGGRTRPDAAVGDRGRRGVGDDARVARARAGGASGSRASAGGRPRRLPPLAPRAGVRRTLATERQPGPAGGDRRRGRSPALDARAQPPGDGLGADRAPLPAPPAPEAGAGRPGRPGALWRPAPPDAPPAALAEGVLAAIVMPVCEEPVERVFAGLRAIHRSLERAGALDRFHFFVLSDSADPSAAVKEEEAWFDWCRAVDGFGRIFYRRRKVRLERKS